MTHMEIVNDIIQNKKALELIERLEPKELRQDMINHIYLILVDYDRKKMKRAFNKGYLDKLVGRIILSQIKSNTSNFWILHRNGGFRKGNTFVDMPKEIKQDNQQSNEFRQIWIEEKTKEIKNILRGREYYHKLLFDMYYFENKTYQQIEKETGINFQSVRVSVMKTLEWIKIKIKYD